MIGPAVAAAAQPTQSNTNWRSHGIIHATLVAPDLELACASYVEQLGLTVAVRETLDCATAAMLDLADLAGKPMVWLANTAGERILRLIEDPQAQMGEPMHRHGWLSLEILVADVDTLVDELRPPFRILGAPANLELSEAIRASQVLGPCGEMLYLTSVKEPVPPFDLPMTDARLSHTFISVMTTPNRTASQTAWAALAGETGWAFDTKITVLNRAFGRDLAGRYPVAVVPLPGQCMVEIDEVAREHPVAPGRRAGQHSIALRLPALPDDLNSAGWRTVDECSDEANRYLGLIGPAGEHIQLVLPN